MHTHTHTSPRKPRQRLSVCGRVGSVCPLLVVSGTSFFCFSLTDDVHTLPILVKVGEVIGCYVTVIIDRWLRTLISSSCYRHTDWSAVHCFCPSAGPQQVVVGSVHVRGAAGLRDGAACVCPARLAGEKHPVCDGQLWDAHRAHPHIWHTRRLWARHARFPDNVTYPWGWRRWLSPVWCCQRPTRCEDQTVQSHQLPGELHLSSGWYLLPCTVPVNQWNSFKQGIVTEVVSEGAGLYVIDRRVGLCLAYQPSLRRKLRVGDTVEVSCSDFQHKWKSMH